MEYVYKSLFLYRTLYISLFLTNSRNNNGTEIVYTVQYKYGLFFSDHFKNVLFLCFYINVLIYNTPD
jgi:hypothetical protein